MRSVPRTRADGVHPGVARGLTFSVDLCQDQKLSILKYGKSMHGIHRGTMEHGRSMTHGMTMGRCHWFLSIRSTIATLARASEALLIVPKPFA